MSGMQVFAGAFTCPRAVDDRSTLGNVGVLKP
jgi:hypothetical protein